MLNDSSVQETKEIQFSLLAIEAKKVALVGEFNNWSPDADNVLRSIGDNPPDPPVFTLKVSYFLNASKDEPNPFHF